MCLSMSLNLQFSCVRVKHLHKVSREDARLERKERTSLIIPTAQNVIYHLRAVQHVLLTHDKQGGEAPVDSVQSEMLRQVIR
jgi:hypothetical protein